MNPVRMAAMAFGLAVFILGAYLFFFAAGLEQWISVGLLTAGIVIFIGLMLMGFASGAPRDAPVTRETRDREVVHDREPARERVVHHHRD